MWFRALGGDGLRAGRAECLRPSGRILMDETWPECQSEPMDHPRFSLPGEVHGARVAGSLVVGDLEAVEAESALTGAHYLAGFLCRLAVITPSVALRLAWRLGVRRWREEGGPG